MKVSEARAQPEGCGYRLRLQVAATELGQFNQYPAERLDDALPPPDLGSIMLATLKQKWHAFQQGTPGHRFQERYERSSQEHRTKPWYQRALKLGASLILVAVGVFFMVFPGPGLPFFIVGAGLLADQSLLVARLLDWTELKVRQMLAWVQARWKKASLHVLWVVAALPALST